MITVQKDGRTQALHSDVQAAAFVANGWEVVNTAETKGEKTSGKTKGSEGAKSSN
ncbi:MAG: hypothetical protein LBQ15_11190 [Clostridium sp.]|jgi:hypothetical protein|nr:hypothetical protein [Clostridium sp.]